MAKRITILAPAEPPQNEVVSEILSQTGFDSIFH